MGQSQIRSESDQSQIISESDHNTLTRVITYINHTVPL